jgi:putative heme-binding domain-containing protein
VEVLSHEADRVLRLTQFRPKPQESLPPADQLAEWVELLSEVNGAGPGDAASGRRLFFSSVGARCAICHQHGGRGGRIGPDLTRVGRSSTRERIIASILQPSQEIAPEYQPWLLVTDDGKSRVGLRMAEAGDDGTEEYVDSEGNQFTLRSEKIESREASAASIMPDGLERTVSLADLRDLLAFLTASDEPR